MTRKLAVFGNPALFAAFSPRRPDSPSSKNMNRADLEHIIRASSAITDQADIVIIGSQSILGQFPDAPLELRASLEADVFARNRPELAIQIDGAIGERSPFNDTFGYYAHGVDETTATLPDGWQQRLVPIRNENTGNGTGWCLEVHDLAASKLAAGREKDFSFVSVLLRERMATAAVVADRIDSMPLPAEQKALLQARLKRLQKGDIVGQSNDFSF